MGRWAAVGRWMRGGPAETRAERRTPWRVFWVALVLRLAYMTLAHQYRIRVTDDHFQFGWEAGRIARAVAMGYGFADPFAQATMPHTGPTAWLPPLYPLLVAGVFRVCGVYTAASAWVVLAVNGVFSAWTAMLVWEIGARCFGRRVGMWSGWLWAVHPAAMQYAVHWVWEMSLTTALFAAVLVLALRMRGVGETTAGEGAGRVGQGGSLGRWAGFGLLWGLIALSNSSLLLFLPVSGAWVWWGQARRGRAAGGAVVAALVFLGCVTPWTWRNYEVFHAWVPMRGNLGVEAYLGNGPGANGLLMEYDHPYQAQDQLRLYAAMGEVRYARMRGEMAAATVQGDRRRFWANVAKRVYFYWASVPHPDDGRPVSEWFRVANFSFLSLAGWMGLAVALRRGRPAAGLMLGAFLLLPLPYYLVTVHARFRHPLEPLICCLGVYLFQAASWGRRAAGARPSVDPAAAARYTS